MSRVKIRTISALEKCFFDDSIDEKAVYTNGTALTGERFSYQIALLLDETPMGGKQVVHYKLESDLQDQIRIARVDNVPSMMPSYPEHDENYLRTEPGLYPDLLRPLSEEDRIYLVPGRLSSVWIDVFPDDTVSEGLHEIQIRFFSEAGEEVGRSVFILRLMPCRLPKQKLIYTQWFHCDCLADYYHVAPFSEEHWEIIESFLKTAADNGVNMILTPIFTPPLDTAAGGERTTTQLVGIKIDGDAYCFDFTKLDRWVELCRRCGIEYFEMSHLFTQWGAYHAPKIMAEKDGVLVRIFGWETDAHGEAYSRFLQAFLPELRGHLRQLGIENHCVFHISDEPGEVHLDSYLKAKQAVSHALSGCTIIDALSHYAFYESGAVEHPVCATDHIEPFLEHKVPNLWAYYCCSQYREVSNRFLSMPSARNRIIGVQLFWHNIVGFLHWGFNFYNNQYSQSPVNPYLCTDGEYFVPSGDAFSVYPAPDRTAWETIHMVVFTHALQDLRAMQLLSDQVGKARVIEIIRETAGMDISFRQYPHDSTFLLILRERINSEIEAVCMKKDAQCNR